MGDILIWAFFGLGFIVMLAMVGTIFRTIWEGKGKKDRWKSASGKATFYR